MTVVHDPAPAPIILANDGEMFSMETYAATMQPLERAACLPAHCYTSTEWYARELSTIFANGWTLLGREDELPHVGSYLALDVAGVGPVFVIRSKDMRVRAFANVCRHRGAKLLREEQGTLTGGIVCPYHAWTYGLDGSLRGAYKMKKTPARCFDKHQFPLMPVRLEQFGGFLFVNAAGGHAPALHDSLGNLPEMILNRWPLADMVTVGRRDYVVDCNWKFVFENTSETYHTAVVHRDSLGAMSSSPVAEHLGRKPVGDWDAIHVHTQRSVVPLPREPAPFPEFANETYFVNLFPSLQLNVTNDCAWWMRMLPLGPGRTRVTQGFLFPRATTALPHFHAQLQAYQHRWALAVGEDNDISLNQQHGITSAFYAPGPYNELEFAAHKFDQWVIRRVLGGGATAADES